MLQTLQGRRPLWRQLPCLPRRTPVAIAFFKRHLESATACGLALWCMLSPATLWATDIQVLAVFSDRAVLQIGDERTQLKIGESSSQGARLLSTDARMGRVRLQLDGQEREFSLGGRVGGSYQTPRQASTRIYRDSSGAYTTTGSINGTAVRFLIDTGASSVVISTSQAQRLNLDYARGVLTPVMTASGNTFGYRIVLDHVVIGSIRQHHVQALVLPGDSPHIALLGMSFLNALNLRNESGALVLEQRY